MIQEHYYHNREFIDCKFKHWKTGCEYVANQTTSKDANTNAIEVVKFCLKLMQNYEIHPYDEEDPGTVK